MKTYEIVVSKHVPAAAKDVYELIRDYRNGHPNILPKRYFADLKIERGGIGDGTRIRFQMRVMGSTKIFIGEVTEPDPGKILVESYPDSGTATSFIVESHGAESHVTIRTELQSRGGLLGALERFTAKRFLTRVYKEELLLLAEFTQKRLQNLP